MAVLSKPTLREKLSSSFDHLFLDENDVHAVLRDFFLSKSAKKLAQKLAEGNTGSDDAVGDNLVDVAVDTVAFQAGSSYQPSVVTGQSIVGLFGEEIDEATLLEECRFTNGDEINLEHRLQSVVECSADKRISEKIFSSEGYAPSDALLIAAVNCFSRKKKRHFFRDGLYLCSVFSKEMGMNLSTFLQVRGWLVVNKKGTISISYRRISECLQLLGKEGAVNYYRLSAMFDRLHRVLHSRDIWPTMPYEKSKLHFLYSCQVK